MKFSYKILLCSITIMAAAFGLGGYFFVDYVFESSMNREVAQTINESRMLNFAFETAALNLPSKYGVLQDAAVCEIGENLGRSLNGSRLCIRSEDGRAIYQSEGFSPGGDFLEQVRENVAAYRVVEEGSGYYIHMATELTGADRLLYLETQRDISDVFLERTQGFFVYRRLTVLLLLCGSGIMYILSVWLTRPIRGLKKATAQMSDGNYASRARQVSHDEMGELTKDFNHMAAVLEETIQKLRGEVEARENFIAAFSHELKTPLTAIIGYADMLRSKKLDEEKQFMSANYIYSEGKRLEVMSLRLLDIIVTRRYELEAQAFEAERLFEFLKVMYAGKNEWDIRISCQNGTVFAEENLIKTVLLNLVDNALKASEAGKTVEITGECREEGYWFCVKDQGTGIPHGELEKITEAFYMVDKSRARGKNGAGLGLALCAEILKLHGSRLFIESTLGEGSSFSFLLRAEEKGGADT